MASGRTRSSKDDTNPRGMLAVGSTSAILVSKGPASARTMPEAVPDVVGTKQAQALEQLQSAGFTVQALRNNNESFPAGVVSHQMPAAGTEVSPGTKVVIFSSAGKVSEGTMLVTLPELVGKRVDEAQALMTAAELRLAVVEDYSETVPAGVAFAQEPNPRTVDRTPAKKSLVWLWVLLALLLVAGVAAFFLFSQKPEDIKVPNLVGATESAASKVLTENGLALGRVTTEATAAVEPGIILSQDPGAGSMAAEGDRIDVVIAEALAGIEIPKVTGKSVAEATAALKSAGLSYRTEDVFSADVATGKVVAQSPQAGTRVQKGAEVALSVSKGPEPVANATVPDISGMTQAKAEAALTAAGLRPRALLGYSETVPVDEVIDQAPAAGASVAPDTQIVFLVSKGAAPAGETLVKVPDLAGMTRDQAEAAVKALGFDDDTREVASSEAAPGKVIGQLPEAGAMVPEGTTVYIAVAKEPLP